MEGSRLTALLPVIGACLLVVLLLPLVLINALLRRLSGGRIPSVIFGPLDRAIFKPYELRRFKHERVTDVTHGVWKRVGDVVAKNPVRVMVGTVAVLLAMCAGLAFFSTDLTTNDSYRTDVESVDGQQLLSQSFPAGASAPMDIVVPNEADVPSGPARSRERQWRRVRVRARGAGRARRADPGNARATAVLDRGLRSGGPDP